MKKKVGILGGTFNPIHNGHLAIARYALDICGLDRVILIPTGTPPHKAAANIVSATQRYEMAVSAAEHEPNMSVSDIEINRQGYAYTADTIAKLREEMPDSELYYIIGADNLSYITQWKDAEQLLDGLNIICISREGYDMRDELAGYGAMVTTIQIPNINVSSSAIREMILKNQDVSEYLPNKVYEYIKNNRLYKEENTNA